MSDEGKKVCSKCDGVVLTSEDTNNTGLCVDCRSKVKCSKENPCQECQKEFQEKLSKCEDWETKRKEDLKTWFPYHSENGNNYGYVGAEGYSYILCSHGCGAVVEKRNNYGDKKESEHTCPKQSQPNTSDLSSLKSYLQTNQIKQISLTNEGELLIEYQNSQTKKTEANNQQLQQIKSYLKQNPSKVISIDNIAEREREREREREQNQPKSNTLLYVSLGLGAIALIGGLVYWFTRKNKKDFKSQ